MLNNIEMLLSRGEKLDELVAKTQVLSDNAKEFYVRSKKVEQEGVVRIV